MKKYLVMMMCAGLLFTATGCGDEKKEEESSSKSDNTVETTDNKNDSKKEESSKDKILRCTDSEEGGIIMVTSDFIYDADGKEMKGVSVSMSIEYDEDELEDFDQDMVDSFCDNIDEQGMKSCKAKLNGNKLVVDVEYDLDEYDFEEEGLEVDKNTPIEELAEILEDTYSTCKIEK